MDTLLQGHTSYPFQSFQIVLQPGNKVFKYERLWGPFLSKPPQTGRHTLGLYVGWSFYTVYGQSVPMVQRRVLDGYECKFRSTVLQLLHKCFWLFNMLFSLWRWLSTHQLLSHARLSFKHIKMEVYPGSKKEWLIGNRIFKTSVKWPHRGKV